MKRALFFYVAFVVLTPEFAEALPIALPSQTDGFKLDQFADVAGIVESGQAISLDFIFQNAPVRVVERSTINTELILYNGPHNPPNPNGDFPYNQYVVFGPGTLTRVVLADGSFVTPFQTLVGIIVTPTGSAGIASNTLFPNVVSFVNGFHYDLVLPNDGKTLFAGEIGVTINQVDEPGVLPMLAVGFLALLFARIPSFGRRL